MAHGKICYVEIPASDIESSARFYTEAFGWRVHVRGDGQRAFDDSTGVVSGSWVHGRSPRRDAGMLFYVMVDSIAATLEKVAAAGGGAVTPATPLGPGGDAYATFTDPAGNLVGLYQQGGG